VCLKAVCLLLDTIQGAGQACIVCPHVFDARLHLLPPLGQYVALQRHFVALRLEHAGFNQKVVTVLRQSLHLQAWWWAVSGNCR
jgi:hypothetical protein